MGSQELGLKEFEILQRYDSEEYLKFEVIRNEEPCFCTQCMDFIPLDGSWILANKMKVIKIIK